MSWRPRLAGPILPNLWPGSDSLWRLNDGAASGTLRTVVRAGPAWGSSAENYWHLSQMDVLGLIERGSGLMGSWGCAAAGAWSVAMAALISSKDVEEVVRALLKA